MIKVEKLSKIPKLSSLQLVAGKSGVNRNIGHVTVMEVPDIIKWLKENDFIITSFYCLKDDIDGQCKLIQDLSLTSCAGIAIKTGQYVKNLSKNVIDTADRCGLPLFIIPFELTYIDIIFILNNCIYESANPRVILEKYIKDILFELYTDTPTMLERGKLLGYNPNENQYIAMTFKFQNGESFTDADLSKLWSLGISIAQLASSFHDLLHNIAVNTENCCSIFLDSPTLQGLSRTIPLIEKEASIRLTSSFPNKNIVIGFGNAHTGLEGIRKTYFESLKAINIGSVFYPENNIYTMRDLEFPAMILNALSSNSTEIYDTIINQLDNSDILQTLIKYFECNVDLDETSRKLYVHKNTVKYRLNRVKELTGLDIKSFNDCLKLYTATIVYKFK